MDNQVFLGILDSQDAQVFQDLVEYQAFQDALVLADSLEFLDFQA
jgi:hypothetical protein